VLDLAQSEMQVGPCILAGVKLSKRVELKTPSWQRQLCVTFCCESELCRLQLGTPVGPLLSPTWCLQVQQVPNFWANAVFLNFWAS
jgi:hypothetical protein